MIVTILIKFVKEFHPFIEPFEETTSPSELLDRLQKSLSSSDDNLFKFERKEHSVNESDIERMQDVRYDRGQEELCIAVRDRIVMDVVEVEKGTYKDINEIEVPPTDTGIEMEETHCIGIDDDVMIKMIDLFHMKKTDSFEEKQKLVTEAMAKMNMGKRDKGDITHIMKVNTLKGRWFGERKRTK